VGAHVDRYGGSSDRVLGYAGRVAGLGLACLARVCRIGVLALVGCAWERCGTYLRMLLSIRRVRSASRRSLVATSLGE